MSHILNKIDQRFNHHRFLWFVFIVFLVLLIWARFSMLDEQVHATGRIIPAGKTRLIQHLEGGIINEILVSEGQEVKQGETIFVVRNQVAESSFNEIAVHLKATEIKLARLEAERQSQSRKSFEASFTQQFSAEEQKAYADIIAAESDLFNARRQAFVEKINGLEERHRQKNLRLSDLRAQIKNLTAEYETANEQLEIKRKLQQSGAISRLKFLEMESHVKNFITRIEQVQKEIPVITAERDEVISLLSETQQIRQSEVIEEINDAKLEMKKLQERTEPMRDQMQRTEIKSPVRGIVNKIYINTLGGVIQPGGSLAEIIPIDETLIVEGRIKTDDRGKIWPGLPVLAKVTAYDYSLYGGVMGTLDYVSADSFTDQQNQSFYQVRASLSAATLGEGKVLYPGMTVDLNIIAGEISVLHAILRPLWRIREKALREK